MKVTRLEERLRLRQAELDTAVQQYNIRQEQIAKAQQEQIGVLAQINVLSGTVQELSVLIDEAQREAPRVQGDDPTQPPIETQTP